MKDPNNPCLFCNSEESGCAHENDLAYASYDSYPVSEYHCLIIPKRHIKDYFDLSNDELVACNKLIKIVALPGNALHAMDLLLFFSLSSNINFLHLVTQLSTFLCISKRLSLI